MDLELEGKTVLITGGSKGIGRAVAEAFAAEGARRLHLVARTAGDLETVKSIVEQAHKTAVEIHALDLSKSANVDSLAGLADEVDILINNAGAIPGGGVDAVDEARWRDAWDLKVFGYINMTRHFLSAMTARGHGVIVNVIGLAGERPDPSYIAGSAANASLMAFTRGLGSTSLDRGVRVLAVNPGPVQTDRNVSLYKQKAVEKFGDPERWQSFLERLPLGRAAHAEEVADAVVFLASSRAKYLSGIVVPVDGGLGAR